MIWFVGVIKKKTGNVDLISHRIRKEAKVTTFVTRSQTSNVSSACVNDANVGQSDEHDSDGEDGEDGEEIRLTDIFSNKKEADSGGRCSQRIIGAFMRRS